MSPPKNTNRNFLFPCDLWNRPSHIRLASKFPRHIEWFLFLLTVAREARTGRLEAGGQPIPPDDLILLPRNPADPDWIQMCVSQGVLEEVDGCLQVAGWADFYLGIPPSKTPDAERQRSRRRRSEDELANQLSEGLTAGDRSLTAGDRSLTAGDRSLTAGDRSLTAERPQRPQVTAGDRTPNRTEPNRTEPQPDQNRTEPDQTQTSTRGKILHAMGRLEIGGPSQSVITDVARYLETPCPPHCDRETWMQQLEQAALAGIEEIANAPPNPRYKIRCKPSVALKAARTKLAESTIERKEIYSDIRITN